MMIKDGESMLEYNIVQWGKRGTTGRGGGRGGGRGRRVCVCFFFEEKSLH